MQNKAKFIALAFLITIPLLKAAPAEEDNSARLRQIDINKNGSLQTNEVQLGILYRTLKSKILLDFPPRDEAIVAGITNDPGNAGHLYSQFLENHGVQKDYAFASVDAETEFELPKPVSIPNRAVGTGPIVPPSRFILRRNLDKTSLLLSETDETGSAMAKDPSKLADGGALFSYGRHFPTDSDQWIAEGLLGWEIPNADHFGDGTLGRTLLSLGFSRIDFGGDGVAKTVSPRFKGEANLLVVGATYESLLLFPQGYGGFEGSSFRANALYKSDWDFQSHIPTVEVEWSPYHGKLGIGSFNTKHEFLYWRIDAKLHADFGHVASDGDWTSSKQDDTFAHVGPKIGTSLIPFPNSPLLEKNPLVLSVDFAYYQPLGGESKLVRMFTAETAWYLRKPGSGAIGPIDPGIALTVSYRNYNNVENQTDDDSLILGLGIGF